MIKRICVNILKLKMLSILLILYTVLFAYLQTSYQILKIITSGIWERILLSAFAKTYWILHHYILLLLIEKFLKSIKILEIVTYSSSHKCVVNLVVC